MEQKPPSLSHVHGSPFVAAVEQAPLVVKSQHPLPSQIFDGDPTHRQVMLLSPAVQPVWLPSYCQQFACAETIVESTDTMKRKRITCL